MNDEVSQLKGLLKEILSKDNLDELFDNLKQNIKPNSSSYNELILLSGRYSNLRKSIINNSINENQKSIELGKLRANLLSYINNMSYSDLEIIPNEDKIDLELKINEKIDVARNQIQTAAKYLDEFRSNFPDGSDKVKLLLFNSRVEEYLNLVELACSMYLENKLDKQGFKSRNIENIKNILNSKKIKKHFFNNKSEKYKSIIKVGEEWLMKDT